MNKPKILIFGGTGMLGSMLTSYLYEHNYDITITSRKRNNNSKIKTIIFDANNQEIFDISSYDWIINCIGIIKQRNIVDYKDFYNINSVFPWKLSLKCNQQNKKLIHISSDCIFDGDLSIDFQYSVNDKPTAKDDYGYSKAIGEPNDCIVLRTSIIGPSKTDNNGLFEWFRNNQNDKIQGYATHFWSGITTLELSKIIENIIQNYYFPSKGKNIFQISLNESISKFNLLLLINEVYNLNKKISNKDSESMPLVNRSLKNNLNGLCDYNVLDIKNQLIELKGWEEA